MTIKLTGLKTGSVDYAFASGKAVAGVGVYLTGIASILAGLVMVPSSLAPIFAKGKKRR